MSMFIHFQMSHLFNRIQDSTFKTLTNS